MFQRRKRTVPGLNATAMADISFMLLIFFLVTSSMDADKGLSRQLPPLPNEQLEQVQTVKQRNVLQIMIDATDRLTCNGDTMSAIQLTQCIVEFVENAEHNPSMPEKSRREVNLLGLMEVSDCHILSIQVDRNTSFDVYFQMQNAIVAAYNQLRNRLAEQRFGHSLEHCSKEELEALVIVYPQRISEQQPTDMEKGDRL